MNKGDENSDPLNRELSDFASDALSFSPEADSGRSRDAMWLRWLKFGSIILVPAVVFGLGFLFVDYLTQYQGETYSERARAERRVKSDTVESMRFRFVIGALVGGGLGLVYVVRCIARRVDP